jgi:AcrR family transcriptional regulator
MSGSSAPRQRRRGAELEAALLDAAWNELVDVGFAKLTMESVAARASTGVAVLYRRWANKDEIVIAALQHYRDTHPTELPDTGSLRGDLTAILKAMGVTRSAFFATIVTSALSGLLDDSGLTPAQARDRILGSAATERTDMIYRRAEERGEIDLATIPSAVLAMPFDLVRHDLLMTLKPLKPARLRAIIDDIFMPLVESYNAGR